MEDSHKYIYFKTLDYKGDYTTNGYTLPITPFTFIPIFDDGLTDIYSNKKILWDFGDGTTSEAITATHYYKLPGWYNVKCYILGKEGGSYSNSFSQNILVNDFITDTIVLSGIEYKSESGAKYPFIVFRFNSWQTYPILSATGYTIHLNISGNIANILDTSLYSKDKWAHLKPYAKFETSIYNTITENYELLPVNSVVTNNKEIYVKLTNKNIVFCKKTDTNSCLAGTSGYKLVYYTDDVPSTKGITSGTIFTSFDKTKFLDIDSMNNNYPNNYYSILNSTFDYNLPSVLLEQLNPYNLVISSNGMDDDNNFNRIHTFDIFPEKFTGQKIPFVARIKEYNGLPAKYGPILKYTNDIDNIIGNNVYICLKDEKGIIITDGITIDSNFGVLSSEIYGGYFKGYLTSKYPLNNVKIYASAVPFFIERYIIDTLYNIVSEPQSQNLHRVQITREKFILTIKDNIVTVPQLTGIYSSCITCDRTSSGTTDWRVWVVDADREKVLKLNPEKIIGGQMEILYDKFVLPDNSSPSNISADKNGNVWITLYDSISTIRINNLTNSIDMVIKPSIVNSYINYENTITPASVDVDRLNNIWVSYSNQLSSFIEKYNQNGNFVTHIGFIDGYQCTEIVTDLKLNVWGILKDLQTDAEDLSSKHDKIFKVNSSGTKIDYYDVDGSLWNIIIDCKGNLWGTKNINEVFQIVKIDNTIRNFYLESNSPNIPNNYISDLEGITCTTDDIILVIDNINKKLHYFNSIELDENNNIVTNTITFSGVGDIPINRIQDKLNGYGDWNGFKFINKFQHILVEDIPAREGYSNTFSIYDSSVGKYDLRKINENFDPIEQLNSYKFQDFLLDKGDSVFKMIGTFIGTLSSDPNYLGKVIYEKISNFTDNIANIDTCNIKSLQSMYDMLDETFYTFGSSNLYYPAELGRLIDLFSINFSKLKGSRNKFAENFVDRGYNNESIIESGGTPIYGVNKGKELDFFTSVLTAGTNIVAFEKFSEQYTLINTNLDISSNYIQYIDIVNKTYALSGLNDNWGWNLSLPEVLNTALVPRYYSFFEYLSGYDNTQSEGIINWADNKTTISENIKSKEEWNDIKQKIINYALAKGLGIIK